MESAKKWAAGFMIIYRRLLEFLMPSPTFTEDNLWYPCCVLMPSPTFTEDNLWYRLCLRVDYFLGQLIIVTIKLLYWAIGAFHIMLLYWAIGAFPPVAIGIAIGMATALDKIIGKLKKQNIKERQIDEKEHKEMRLSFVIKTAIMATAAVIIGWLAMPLPAAVAWTIGTIMLFLWATFVANVATMPVAIGGVRSIKQRGAAVWSNSDTNSPRFPRVKPSPGADHKCIDKVGYPNDYPLEFGAPVDMPHTSEEHVPLDQKTGKLKKQNIKERQVDEKEYKETLLSFVIKTATMATAALIIGWLAMPLPAAVAWTVGPAALLIVAAAVAETLIPPNK